MTRDDELLANRTFSGVGSWDPYSPSLTAHCSLGRGTVSNAGREDMQRPPSDDNLKQVHPRGFLLACQWLTI